jgi:3-oxoacyl-[acyl-carrier protein] reductase
MKLVGKVAVVTGGGRGLGRETAMLLAYEGAKVVVDDIDDEPMCRVVEEIGSKGGSAIGFKADVANRLDVQKLVQAAIENYGGIHIMVNNAGIRRSGTLLQISEEDWDIVLNVDLKGVFNCIQAVAHQMMEQRYGKIINISSVSGTGTSNAPASYAAAKGGVIQLTKVAARELGPYGINVNCIAPGRIVTKLPLNGPERKKAELQIEARKQQAVLGRVGLPQDIANLILFLASDESSFITGQVICADGGRIDRM